MISYYIMIRMSFIHINKYTIFQKFGQNNALLTIVFIPWTIKALVLLLLLVFLQTKIIFKQNKIIKKWNRKKIIRIKDKTRQGQKFATVKTHQFTKLFQNISDELYLFYTILLIYFRTNFVRLTSFCIYEFLQLTIFYTVRLIIWYI